MGRLFFPSLYVGLLLISLSVVSGNTELRALMELKSGLDPTNKLLRSWRSDGEPCSGSFEGVACNEHRKVANISLQGKGLSGTLSPAISELKCLSGLYLHYNSLSGEIPIELANLTELSDLYLNVNNFSGNIPPRIANMAALQVVELCCNQLTGEIPTDMGSLKKLSVIALQYNNLSGQIPSSLESLPTLTRLDLGFNSLSGGIPRGIAQLPRLQLFDVRNNSLSGIVPSALQRLNEGFNFENNRGLCGAGIPALRACSVFDNVNINEIGGGQNHQPLINDTLTKETPEKPSVFHAQPELCSNNQTSCSKSKSSPKLPQIAIVAGVITVTIALMSVCFLVVFRYRRRKQKIGNASSESPDSHFSGSHDHHQVKELQRGRSLVSPLVSLEYPNGFHLPEENDNLNSFMFNLEEIESATLCFSEANLLGKGSFSSVYRGVLRDGSDVAITSINMTSCKSEDSEFAKGLSLLTSLRHDNLVRLRGFCCSKGRGECYLVYDFAPKGKLSKYLEAEEGSTRVLDWSTRVSIINGIAKGLGYLHRAEASKPTIIHRNISVDKIMLDRELNPLIAESGLPKLLADDIIFLTLKTSAAMGYLAPEYITTGSFTEKSDVYAYGAIILQVLCGRHMLPSSMRTAAASCKYQDFIDKSLKGNFSEHEAGILADIALRCTHELPDERPDMEAVIEELNRSQTFTS
ncbi:LRR receptor kinase SERK2 [Linum grandiflorum]